MNIGIAPEDSTSLVETYRAQLRADDARLRKLHEKKYSAQRIVSTRTQSVDTTLRNAWNEFFSGHEAGDHVSLIAVGGYGREELNPCSDIDIMLLLDQKNNGHYDRIIKPFTRFLWDIGFEVGHSVRTIGDCIKQSRADLTVMTTLLEARYCAGSQALFRQFESRIQDANIWPARKFFEAKVKEQKLRHHKYSDTAYNLEPNIKDGPGGLRDIHTVSWVTMRHFGSRGLHELVLQEFLQEDEFQTLIRGRNYLWKLRNELHLTLGRREDRLLFDNQLKLADKFGFLDDDSNKAVEKLMKPYFRTVKVLRHINQMLLQHFDESILTRKRHKVVSLNGKFQTVDGYLDFVDAKSIDKKPEMLLDACVNFQSNCDIRGIRAAALRLMRSKKYLVNRQLRNSTAVKSQLLSVFSNPQRLPQTLDLMHDTGLLGRLIPDFNRIVGQLQYDLFHVYTVDAHLLNVVWHIHELGQPAAARSVPLAAAAMKRIIKPERLFIAGLFHDIAKGQGGDHSELGEVQSYRFCKRIGMDEYDSHFVAWLVRQHLAMSFTSQREDLNDPDVISRFAAKVGNQEHLDHLFVLTIADMRGTGPKVWNDWKGKMLDHLYLATSRTLLTNVLPHDEVKPQIEEIKADCIALLGKDQTLRNRAVRLWSNLEDDYFLSYDAGTIEWHVRHAAKTSLIDLPLVVFRPHPSIDVIQIFVLAANSDEQFTIITGALDYCSLNVLEARTHPLRSGLTAFSFVVMVRNHVTDGHNANLEHFERTVAQAIVNRQIQHLPSAVKPDRVARHIVFPTRIEFTHSPGSDYTVMEIFAQDRPGLLYFVVRTLLLHKVKLLSAKITTSGARAEDVFFIVDRDGDPIFDQAIKDELKKQIIQQLG
ncbi:MAG: [protein-PII] uridylyltransferase [Acidiferrobacterales bacterium]|nr:[protein-PII] uridylyltransferase [Acidiferrobacterales bacterium]